MVGKNEFWFFLMIRSQCIYWASFRYASSECSKQVIFRWVRHSWPQTSHDLTRQSRKLILLVYTFIIHSPFHPGIHWSSTPHSLKASHLFQLKNSSDVWLDAPLLTVLKSRGQAPGEDRKVLVPVSAPVHSHGRDILQEQKIGRNRSNGSSTKANHHNPALPGQAEGKKEKKL